MAKSSEDAVLLWAARRAERRTSFLASTLAAYRSMHDVEEEQLARFLACPVKSLPTLALCKRPDPNASDFRKDVERIASFVGADGVQLGKLLREVETVEALRGAAESSGQTGDAGMLAAARDAGLEETKSSRDAGDRGEEREGSES